LYMCILLPMNDSTHMQIPWGKDHHTLILRNNIVCLLGPSDTRSSHIHNSLKLL
jgi:hypothetical protein